jgi:hypothetical protein
MCLTYYRRVTYITDEDAEASRIGHFTDSYNGVATDLPRRIVESM